MNFPEQPDFYALGYKLHRTSIACPEQYDILDQNDIQTAYFRLRHGRFYASCPDIGGEIVYDVHPKGDGIFDKDERDMHLGAAILAVDRWVNKKLNENKAD